jgi:phosphoribosylglycinamide formyltransferase-1
MERPPFRLGVLGSGKGSNMAAVADACADGRLPAEVVLVLADNPDAGILGRARERGIRAEYVTPGKYRTKLEESAEQEYVKVLRGAGVEWVVLAGFMRILKAGFLRAFPRRVLNIHPALLPAFPGLEAWKQALDYGVKVTGCTVHLVDEGIDTGPILVQRVVPVRDEDTPEILHARIQEQERIAYVEALNTVFSGQMRWSGRRALSGHGDVAAGTGAGNQSQE